MPKRRPMESSTGLGHAIERDVSGFESSSASYLEKKDTGSLAEQCFALWKDYRLAKIAFEI